MAKKKLKKKCNLNLEHLIRTLYEICLVKNMNLSALFMSPLDRREVFGWKVEEQKEALNFIKKYLDI